MSIEFAEAYRLVLAYHWSAYYAFRGLIEVDII